MSGGDMSATTQRRAKDPSQYRGGSPELFLFSRRGTAIWASEEVSWSGCGRRKGVLRGGHDFLFISGTRGASRPAARGASKQPHQVRSSISSPLDADAIRSPNSSVILTRRDRTVPPPAIYSLFASTQQGPSRKKTRNSRVFSFFSLFSWHHADQETQSSPTKEYACPVCPSPLLLFFCSFSCCFSILAISELQHPLIHSVLIPSHRPACGALRPTTRVDARMLGSHERRQINRGLSRACSDSL